MDVAVPVGKDIVVAQLGGLGALLGSGFPSARGALFTLTFAGRLALLRGSRFPRRLALFGPCWCTALPLTALPLQRICAR